MFYLEGWLVVFFEPLGLSPYKEHTIGLGGMIETTYQWDLTMIQASSSYTNQLV
jgi:hypothetical protein